MIGKKFKKPLQQDYFLCVDKDGKEFIKINENENTFSNYAKASEWANNNGCIIEDCGDFYEVKKIPEKTIDQLKFIKLIKINNAYNEATEGLVKTYPSTEVLTFDKQESEARAWLDDNTVSTPLIDALALGRGIDKAELVRRIIVKAEAFATATGYLTGQRQRYEDLLDAATMAEEIEAIVPEYVMPQGMNL